MADMEKRRRPPEWLVGLLIAIVVVTIVLLVAGELGFGDNPTLG